MFSVILSAKYLEELKLKTSCTGTAVYMAPEAHQQRDVSAKADIWSLGCTVIEMANGFGPIWAEYSRYKMYLFIAGNEFDPQIPEELGEDGTDFVTQCLVQIPQQRCDASTLLKTPFILHRQPEPDYGDTKHTLLTQQSDASLFEGIPLFSRHISADQESMGPIELDHVLIAKDGKSEGGDNRDTGRISGKSLYLNSLKSTTRMTSDERPTEYGGRSVSLSRQSSAIFSRAQSTDGLPILRSIHDVQEVVRIKSQAVRRKHLKWLAKENSKARTGDFGEWIEHEQNGSTQQDANPQMNHNESPLTKTIHITKGLSKNQAVQEFIQKTGDEVIEFDYQSD